jgi:hypothetical protein
MPRSRLGLAVSRIPPWSIALFLFGASFLLLELCVDTPPLHEDTARDLLLARDCVDAGRCAMAGPTASFGGLAQGALWIHLLETSRAAGLGIRGVRAIVLALASAAAALVAFTPRRLCGWSAGPAAWAVMIAATASTIELPVLWNPSALPLPLALFYLALLALAASGDLLSAAALGVTLSLSIDAHVVCVGLVPLAVGVVVATAARPVLASFTAGSLLVCMSLASSVGAVTRDLPSLSAERVPSFALLAISVSIGVAARRRTRAASAQARVRAVLWAACGYFGIAVALACWATGHPLAPRYVAPIVPAAAILAAGVAIGALGGGAPGLRRALVGNAAVVLAAVVVLLTSRHPFRGDAHLSWTAVDAEVLAPFISARGWTYGDLYRHLRGPESRALLAALAPYLPAPDGTPHSPPQDDVLLLKVSAVGARAPDAARWIVADLPGGAVALSRSAPSWLDASLLDLCVGHVGSEPRCVRTGLGRGDPDRGAQGTVSQRAYPELENLGRDLSSSETNRSGTLRWTIALRLRPHMEGVAHVLTLADRDPSWRIERVDGARYRGSLPSREVILEDVSGEGRIVFAVDVTVDRTAGFRAWLPSMIETSADEVVLRDLGADRLGSPTVRPIEPEATFVAATPWAGVAHQDEPGTCDGVISADAAHSVFDRLRARVGADGCSLSDLRTEQTRMRIQWTKGTESLPEATIDPVECAPVAAVAGDTLALSSPPLLSAACPDALSSMRDAVLALSPPTAKLPPAYPKSLAIASWIGVALALFGTMIVAVTTLRRGCLET